ncbi:endothelin-converting enzyme homolog [Sitophilus oryzae]|uniref:Endothelin-converting enzyme homolog n=1 Tax=Sitophilus oryzae TaxID=7048 RepID=A0A6J2XS43_SITOR|nr:endothelin-converting enzyme homolog [Sitophilus oryzae]
MMFQVIVFVNIVFSVFGSVPFFVRKDWTNKDMMLKNKTINPCNNFYEYSCSKWFKETTKPPFEPSWNHFTEASYELNKKIRQILEKTHTKENYSLGKSQRFYQSCVNFEENQSVYLENLRTILNIYINDLRRYDEMKSFNYKVMEQIMRITRNLDVYPIFKFSVNIDYKDTKNYILYIEPGNLIFPSSILLNPNIYQEEISSYVKWISKSTRHVLNINKSNYPKFSAVKIVEFEIELAKLMSTKSNTERNSTEHFSNMFDFDFINAINENLFIDTTRKIRSNDVMVVRNFEYFKSVFFLFKTYNTETIENYLLWSIIKELSRDTNRYLKNLNFIIDRNVLNVKKDIPRNTECTSKVLEYFSYALLPKYVRLYFDEKILEDIQDMVKNIKDKFIEVLAKNDWMSQKTKLLAMKKIGNIKCNVGYPKWIKNVSIIEEYYSDVNISTNHLLNILMVKREKSRRNFELFKTAVADPVWPSNVFDVNAYYSVLQNSIFLPLGILQKPFYDYHTPKIFNYGAIGSLIGHEFAHSLDTTGRQTNSEGTVTKWWRNQDIFIYNLKAKCYENTNSNKQISNSLITDETIADNVGLELSFEAYKKSDKNVDLEEVFWGRNYNSMFFLSYSQMWCEISNKKDLTNDEHSSPYIRVNQALYNNKQFVKLFNCNFLTKSFCNLW